MGHMFRESANIAEGDENPPYSTDYAHVKRVAVIDTAAIRLLKISRLASKNAAAHARCR